jgi:hypothetical protein
VKRCIGIERQPGGDRSAFFGELLQPPCDHR